MGDTSRKEKRNRYNGLTMGHQTRGFRHPKSLFHKEGNGYIKVNYQALKYLQLKMRAVLNPAYAHPVRELKDMTPEERTALEEKYQAKIK